MDTSTNTGQGKVDLALQINQAVLGWYSTIKQKPVQSGQPGSIMRSVLGADLGSGQGTGFGQATGGLTSLLAIAVIAIAGVFVVRKVL